MNTHFDAYQRRFEGFAEQHLPHVDSDDNVGLVYLAMRYSFFAGGKRLRPALVYGMADSIGVPLDSVDSLALAVECIHTYSLIHDDLPAMDDDDLRRGRPACHKQFDEATAILAGDALNTLAFELLAKNIENTPANQRLQQIALLGNCAGIDGMVGGQDMDLQCEKRTNVGLDTLTTLHSKKTAKLIEACLLMPTFATATVTDNKRLILSDIARSIGLFYQIQDDILDVTQSAAVLGKPAGSDVENEKTTYVSVLGLDTARETADTLATQIQTQLIGFFAPQQRYQDTALATVLAKIIQRKY